MLLKSLTLFCFRNYQKLSFSPAQRTLVVGDNGRGKTNLLEALVLLTQGRSFRACLPETLIQTSQPTAHIVAQTTEEKALSLKLERAGKRSFFIDNRPARKSDIACALPTLFFGPESLLLLKGPAVGRRWWLDDWLSAQGQAEVVRDFSRILLRKNQLLKQIQKGELSRGRAKTLLESINELFAEKNQALVQARKQALEELTGFFKEGVQAVLEGALGAKEKALGQGVRLKYLKKGFEGAGKEGGEEEDRLKFYQKMEQAGEKECGAGLSLYGAHRDDFWVSFHGRDSRFFCSQGQQRSLLLALKIAQILWLYRIQKKPGLLLLDDVFSEIDKHTVLNLLCFLNEVPSQIILTSTAPPSFLDRKKFWVFHLGQADLRKEYPGERGDSKNFPICGGSPFIASPQSPVE